MKKQSMKKRFMRRHSISLKLMFIFLAVTASGVIVLSGFFMYRWSDEMLTQKAMDLSRSSLAFYGGMLDQTLESINDFGYSILYENEDMNILSETADQEKRYYAKKRVIDNFEQILHIYQILDGVLFYAPDAPREQWIVQGGSRVMSLSESRSIQEEFCRMLEKNQEFPVKWFLYEMENENYLFRIVCMPKGYYAFWIREESLNSVYEMNGEERLYLAPGEEENMEEATNSYMQVSIPSAAGDFLLCGSLDVEHSMLAAQDGVRFLRFLCILAIAFPAVLILLFSRIFYRFYRKLYRSMEKVGAGDLTVRIKTGTGIREADFIFTIFNSMTEEIVNLKTENYEREIREQKTQLQYLRIQLKSHFFLNCLNIIYSLAQVKDYALIQKMTLCLTEYFRYIGKDSFELVEFDRELAHIRNYLEIQKMRFPGKFEVEIREPENAHSFFVPPLILQTFLENSIRYGVSCEKELQITILAEKRIKESETGLWICIADSGEGFQKEFLKKMEEEPKVEMNLEHGLGINNVRSRLNILYHGRSEISFYNREGQGAVVELFLPQPEGGTESVYDIAGGR